MLTTIAIVALGKECLKSFYELRFIGEEKQEALPFNCKALHSSSGLLDKEQSNIAMSPRWQCLHIGNEIGAVATVGLSRR